MLKPQRRSHNKSRTGCVQCKSRRVKCDEHRPQCYNCKRRESECDYSLPPLATSPRSSGPASSSASASSTPASAPSSGVSILLQSAQRDYEPVPSSEVVSLSAVGAGISDIELMHHYTLVTAPDFGENGTAPNQVHIWQKHVPQLAFSHQFLLKGILALSALHLCHTLPSRKSEFSLKATALQQDALKQFQDTLPKLDESNCLALLSFACLLIPITFAMGDEPSADKFHWVWLIRRGFQIAETHEEYIHKSFLDPILQDIRRSNVESSSSHDFPYVTHLASLFEVSRGLQDEDASRACIVATHLLLSTFLNAYQHLKKGESPILGFLAWPAHLSEKFLELLSQREPEALVVLGFYCVLIHEGAQLGAWFFKGSANRMLESIKSQIPDSYHKFLEWPEKMIYDH